MEHGGDVLVSEYPKEVFIKNSQTILSIKPEIVVGALHGIAKDKFTKLDVKNAVEKFLKTKLIGGNK